MKPSRETRQKELLRKELNSIKSLFTAENIYKKAKTKDSNLGIATVYRFLKELRKKDQLHSYTCNRKIIYSKEHASHCHFTCQNCNKVTHFNINKLDFIKNHIKGDTRVSICV